MTLAWRQQEAKEWDVMAHAQRISDEQKRREMWMTLGRRALAGVCIAGSFLGMAMLLF